MPSRPGEGPRSPRLTRLDEAGVWLEAQRHRGLVGLVAGQFLDRGLDFEDLFDEGMLAVHRAVEIHDPSLSRFSTYAYRAIQSRMIIAIGRQTNVHVPPYARVLARRAHAGRIDVAALPARTRGCVRQAMRVLGLLPGADADRDAGGPCTAETKPDRIDPEQWAEVGAAMDRLPAAERDVLRAWCGLDRPALTLKQVGAARGCSKVTAQAIKDRALAHLRAILSVSEDAACSSKSRTSPR